MEKQLLFLSLEDVIASGGADIHLAINDMQLGFELLHEGGSILQPPKTTLKIPVSWGKEEGEAGLVNFLPAYVRIKDTEIYSCKALGAMPSNVAKGIPRATGLITLFDSETKSPLCMMDAQTISAMRTGAVSALATKKFVAAETTEVGMIGAGVNMRTQLLGIHASLPHLKKVYIHSRGDSKYHFAEEMGDRLHLEIIPMENAQDVVERVSFLVTCLPNITSPVVKSEWVTQKGMTIFNIGCYECEDKLVGRMDRIVADRWEQGKHRGAQSHAIAYKNGCIKDEQVEDLSPIIVGAAPGRTNADQNIFFCPTGMGFEDAILASRVYQQAKLLQLGTSVTLWKSSKWI